MFGKKKTSPKIDKALAKSVNYEVSLADLAHRSERRAWFVAASAMALALILAGGYFFLLPLKERVPFLVLADAYTGTATIAKLTSDLSQSSITANQAINRSNIAHYVIARESYDYDLLNARDWRVVYTMSSQEVANVYADVYSEANPENPIKLYGTTGSIRINIISITPTSEGWFGQTGGANVRFQRVLVNKTNGGTEILDTKSATLSYTYNEELPLSEEQRFDNPLGFQVTNYRVVDELVSLPVQPPSAAAPGPQRQTVATPSVRPQPGAGATDASQISQGVAVPPFPAAHSVPQAAGDTANNTNGADSR